jgi:Flp pilus assembly pilin Flp
MHLINDLFARLLIAGYASKEREEGQTLVEYALIIALVSIALVASLTALKGGIGGAFDKIIAALG